MLCRTPPAVETFEYPTVPMPLPILPWKGIPEIGGPSANESALILQRPPEPLKDSAALESVQGFEAGFEQGIREGRLREQNEKRAALLDLEKKRVEQAARFSEQFAKERDRFLQSVENEVVKLALAIAIRILRREAQIDPLCLIGAVQEALGQLAETMSVRLRVPSADCELWSETLARKSNLKVKPTVIEDERLQLGACVIETELGSVDLGMCAQLDEIERSLFDGAPAAKARDNLTRNELQEAVQS